MRHLQRAALALLFLLTLALTAVSAPHASAASAGDAVLKRDGGTTSYVTVCANWNATTNICDYRSATGRLYGSENTKTKYGWADADGIYIASGDRCVVDYGGGNVLTFYGGSNGLWHKISGSFGATRWVTCYH